MATDQGKLANVNGLAIMAELTGASIAETGTTTFRPPHTPVTIGALAGHHRGRGLPPDPADARPRLGRGAGRSRSSRAACGCAPPYFPRGGEDWFAACEREVRAIRAGAGVCDVSTWARSS